MRRTAIFLMLAGLTLAGCTASDEQVLDTSEAFPGGDATGFFVSGSNAYTMPIARLTAEERAAFATGNSLFNQAWVTAPASTDARDGLGPTFNARSCSSCHFKDGRSPAVREDGTIDVGMLFRLSVDGPRNEAPLPHPAYGGQLQPDAVLGVPAEGRVEVSYEEVRGEYGDGIPFTLQKPRYRLLDLAFGDAKGVLLSPRVSPAMVGLGLLEAVKDETLEALADPEDEDEDGISGRVQRVLDVRTQRKVIGRFGWKAEQPSVLQQSAGAFAGDLGITSSLFADTDCPLPQVECSAAQNGGAPELSDALLSKVDVYLRTLAVPARSRWDADDVQEGKQIFAELGCSSCHVPTLNTGSSEIAQLSEQKIFPYTDLLLHDMGEGLSDGRATWSADGSEWRTPPLWGIGRVRQVNRHDQFLHDGRARGFAEAILWHGGEAEAAKEAFRQLPAEERALLVTFLESL